MESPGMGHVKNLPAIQTGSGELPTLPVAYLHQGVHYEIRVTVTGRDLSGDPAMGEYFPVAPVNDDAKKHNGNLPGQEGVFNYVNLHAYHYAGNNPVKYRDPDGEVSEKIRLAQENDTKAKLKEIISSPEKYIMKSFIRKAFFAYSGDRGNNMRHSFYVVINEETNETFTLSFNGSNNISTSSKGYWWINSDKDQESISTPENVRNWAVEETTPTSGINVKKTAENILKRIEDSKITYFLLKERLNKDMVDSVELEKIDNCNTALEATRISNE
jgi:hypothetical protein